MCLRIDSNDINLLIYHYLKERGLEHTAFTFHSEAHVVNQALKPGSLVNYMHKALTMEELLYHLNEDVTLTLELAIPRSPSLQQGIPPLKKPQLSVFPRPLHPIKRRKLCMFEWTRRKHHLPSLLIKHHHLVTNNQFRRRYNPGLGTGGGSLHPPPRIIQVHSLTSAHLRRVNR